MAFYPYYITFFSTEIAVSGIATFRNLTVRILIFRIVILGILDFRDFHNQDYGIWNCVFQDYKWHCCWLALVRVDTEHLAIGHQVTIQHNIPIMTWVLSDSLSQKARHAQLTFHYQMEVVIRLKLVLFLEMPLTHALAILLHSLFCQNPYQ